MKANILLLFKNAFKQAFRNKIQLIGLAILVLLSSTIFSLMQTSIARVNNEYNALISENQSNIHDFVFDPYNAVKKTSAPKPPNPPDPEASLEDQQLYLNEISTNNFIWDRVEARTIQLNNNSDPKILKLITYNKEAKIDKLVINQGYNIGENTNNKTPTNKQAVVNKEFAEKNKLKIGDVIRIQEDRLGTSLKVNYDLNNPLYSSFNWLQIVGYGNSADFITPIIDETTPLPNKTKEGIIYVDPSQFGLTLLPNINNNTLWYYNKAKEIITISSNKDVEIYYVGKWNTSQKDITKIVNFLQECYVNTTNSTAKLVYALGDNNYRFNNRTATLPSTINAFITLLIFLLLIVLVITGITIVLITYKNIENSKPQIGILKSLGYSNSKILITSLAYPMIAALVGTILVFFPASGLQILVVQTFANYFNLNFGSFVFDGLGYLYCLLLTFGFLSIIAWIISALTVIKKPITLINNISATRDSKFTKFVKKTSAHRPFLTRFRLALFTSSIGKMTAASLTMFLGTTLMTTAIIGPKIMDDNKKVSYTGMNYKYLTEYVNPTYNSPFTFYKTYNPNNIPKEKDDQGKENQKIKPWKYQKQEYEDEHVYYHPERDDAKYADELYHNDINSEAYAPISKDPKDASSLLDLSTFGLTYLYGKMMTKSFLNNLDKSTTDPSLLPIIIALAWPEAQPPYNIAEETNLYNDENYQSLRIFYSNYRSTIDMNLNSKVTKENPDELNPDELSKFASISAAWSQNKTDFENEAKNFKFDKSDSKYPWHIENETELLNNSKPLNEENRNAWIRKTMIWFYSIFYNRVGQSVAQGTYTKSPYFIKQNIAKAFENPDQQFNISFNVIPFDQKTDELGTYFVGLPDIKFNNKQYPIKIYGLQNEKQLGRPSLMQLYDKNGNSLNNILERTNNDNAVNIVINQTTAKQLQLEENQIFYMSTNGKVMKAKNDDETSYKEVDINKVHFDKITENIKPENINNANLLNQYSVFEDITRTSGGAYANTGVNATPMLKEVAIGNVVIENNNDTWHKFKVSGIYNGYGQPSAYISKTHADELLHFVDYHDKNNQLHHGAIRMFYQIFQKEWAKKANFTVGNIEYNFDKLEKETFEDFNQRPENDPLKIIFKNEFPIFNFKLSNASELWDTTQTFSVSQDYGDYSAIGLNGGLDKTDSKAYKGYGQGSVANLLPIYVHRQLLNQITQLVNTILLFFIIFSLVISFFIILLTSNLIIYENKKIIVTMKTLGYSDTKITNIVIGMYLPVIGAMFILGFPVGLFIVKYIINYLAYNTTWVLPFFFAWWIPFVVGLIVLGIYALTFIIEWQALKRIKILKVMNENN